MKLLERILPARRIEDAREMLRLPEEPADLVLARNNVQKLDADLKRAREFFEFINFQHKAVDVRAPDGTIVAEVTEAVIVRAFRDMQKLEQEIPAARGALGLLVRQHGDNASDHVERGCEVVRQAVLDHLDQIDEWLGLLANLRLHAQGRGIMIRDRSVTSVSGMVSHVRELRRSLGG